MGSFHKGMSSTKQKRILQKANQVQESKPCLPSKTELSFKPLQGKIFYLDLRTYRGIAILEEDLEALGGTIEKFLSKDVSYVITNRKDQLEDLCKTSTSCSTPSPFSTEKKNMGGSVDSPLNTVDSPLGSTTNDKIIMTRGQAIIQKVTLSAEKRGTSDVLDNARRWGVQVRHIDSVIKWIEKQRKKNLIRKDKTEEKVKVSTSSRGRLLHPPFIKFEATNRHYRAVYKEFDSWPYIDTCSKSGACPFNEKYETTKRITKPKENIKETKLKDQRTCAKVKSPRSAQEKKKVQKNRRSGYCEICCVKYDDLDMHIQGEQHQTFVSNHRNYAQLDSVITQGPDIHQLLKDCISNKIPPTINSPQSCEEIKFISELTPRISKKKRFSRLSRTRRALTLNSTSSPTKKSELDKCVMVVADKVSNEMYNLKRLVRSRTSEQNNSANRENYLKNNVLESDVKSKTSSSTSLQSPVKLRTFKRLVHSNDNHFVDIIGKNNHVLISSNNHLLRSKAKVQQLNNKQLSLSESLQDVSLQAKENSSIIKNVPQFKPSPIDNLKISVRRSSRNKSQISENYGSSENLDKNSIKKDDKIDISFMPAKLCYKADINKGADQLSSPNKETTRILRSSRSPNFLEDRCETIQSAASLSLVSNNLLSKQNVQDDSLFTKSKPDNNIKSNSIKNVKVESLPIHSSVQKDSHLQFTLMKSSKKSIRNKEKNNSSNNSTSERRQTRFQSLQIDSVIIKKENNESHNRILPKIITEPLSEILELTCHSPQRILQNNICKKASINNFVQERTFSNNKIVNNLGKYRSKELLRTGKKVNYSLSSEKDFISPVKQLKCLNEKMSLRKHFESQLKLNSKNEEKFDFSDSNLSKKRKKFTGFPSRKNSKQVSSEDSNSDFSNQRVLRTRASPLILPKNLCKELLKENIQLPLTKKPKTKSLLKNKRIFKKKSYRKFKKHIVKRRYIASPKCSAKKKAANRTKSRKVRKVRLKTPINLLTDRSMLKLLYGDSDDEYFEGFYEDTKELPTDLSFMEVSQLEVNDSDNEWIFSEIDQETSEFEPPTEADLDFAKFGSWLTSAETSEWDGLMDSFILRQTQPGMILKSSEDYIQPELRIETEMDSGKENKLKDVTSNLQTVNKNDSLNTIAKHNKEEADTAAALLSLRNSGSEDSNLMRIGSESILMEKDTNVRVKLSNSNTDLSSPVKSVDSGLLVKSEKIQINEIKTELLPISSIPLNGSVISDMRISEEEILAGNYKVRHCSAPDTISSLDLNSSFDPESIPNKKEKISLETLDTSEDESSELDDVKSTVNNILTVLNSSELDKNHLEAEIIPAKIKRRRFSRSHSLTSRSSTGVPPKSPRLSKRTSIDRLISTCKMQRRHSSASLPSNEESSSNSSRFSARILKGRSWRRKISSNLSKKSYQSAIVRTPKLKEPPSKSSSLTSGRKVSLLEENYEFKEDDAGGDVIPGRYISSAR